jgi:hypothetical protein
MVLVSLHYSLVFTLKNKNKQTKKRERKRKWKIREALSSVFTKCKQS